MAHSLWLFQPHNLNCHRALHQLEVTDWAISPRGSAPHTAIHPQYTWQPFKCHHSCPRWLEHGHHHLNREYKIMSLYSLMPNLKIRDSPSIVCNNPLKNLQWCNLVQNSLNNRFLHMFKSFIVLNNMNMKWGLINWIDSEMMKQNIDVRTCKK